MNPGTIITDIEGLDLGPEGAVVVQVTGDEVELARLDTKEFITVQLDELDYHAEDAPEGEGFTPSGYDESALDSPELHTIRNQPNWWGPRDPNNPSPLTDVSYRPEPIWRRQQHRHYDFNPAGDIRMTHKRNPKRRTAGLYPWYVLVDDEYHDYFGFGATCEEAVEDAISFYRNNSDYRPMDRKEIEALSCYPATQEFYEEGGDDFVIDHGKAMLPHESDSYLDAIDAGDDDPPQRFGAVRRTPRLRAPARRTPRLRAAEPMPWMDPVPRSTAAQQQLQREYGLPRRMELHRWAESKDDALDTEVLVAHTVDFWKQYRAKRYRRLSSTSSSRGMDLRNWGLMYMGRAGLERDELELLYRFMVATALIPEKEYLDLQDTLDSHAVFPYSRGV